MPEGVPTSEGLAHPRDAAAWAGRREPLDPNDEDDRVLAEDYITAHPRPSSGIPQAQRLALVRRLAAGPATTRDLLEALRQVGWVAASDLTNRLRELRRDPANRRGAGAAGLDLVEDGGTVRMSTPLPMLDTTQAHALGFAKAVTGQLDGPMADAAARALDHLLPGIAPTATGATPGTASLAALERFHAALVDGRPARVRYDSRNSRTVRHLNVIPVRYHTMWGAVKAVCLEVDEAGNRGAIDRQLALDRVLEVTLLDWPRPADLAPITDPLVLALSGELLRVAQERDLFGLGSAEPEQLAADPDVYLVEGSFPRALAWDVLEQMCAWAGSVQVREPLWLVNAVCRRLRAGLQEMEFAGGFELVKPDPTHTFDSHGEAVQWEPPPPSDDGLARRIAPPASAR